MTQEELNELANLKSAQEFASQFMAQVKLRNKANSIGLSQAMWVHQKLRALEVNIPENVAQIFPAVEALAGQTLTIDLLNMVISGDLETAYVTLLFATPDDMSQPYHWLSAENLAEIRTAIGQYLGWE